MRGFRKAFYVVLNAVILVDPIFFSPKAGVREIILFPWKIWGVRGLYLICLLSKGMRPFYVYSYCLFRYMYILLNNDKDLKT